MKNADVMIVGAGSLATGIVNGLSGVAAGKLRVAVVGRSAEKIAQMALIANARAITFGSSATFKPIEVPEFEALGFSRVIRTLKPKVILHVASLQSPWETSQAQSAWTKLLAVGGFGTTLPLQLALAAETSRGAEDSEAVIINASYPDCVNLVFHRLGLRTTCGIGNAAIVEAFCRSDAKVGNRDVCVVAHHGHLGVWLRGAGARSQPRVWVNDREVESLRLRPGLESVREELNAVTAATAVSLLLAVLTGRTARASIPGVAGLPGGYPFMVKGGKFTLRLPKGINLEEAIAHNQDGERLDGLELGSGVKFVGKAAHALAAAGFEYAKGFDFAEWPSVSEKMIALRSRLRRVPN